MKTVLLLALLAALSGCLDWPPAVPPRGPEVSQADSAARPADAAANADKGNRYREAVTAQKKIAASSPQSDAAADALCNAGYLLAYYDNPRRDYAQALRTFEVFLRRFPRHPRAPEARNWRAILTAILELQKNIEELRRIDVMHEKKRGK